MDDLPNHLAWMESTTSNYGVLTNNPTNGTARGIPMLMETLFAMRDLT